MRREENNLSWYVRHSEEVLLKNVGDSNVVNISVALRPKGVQSEWSKLDREWMEAEKNAWAICERRRRYWGDRTWQWIARGDLKGFSEALICSAQEQALRTNYTKFHKDDTAESLLCRICRSKGETVAMLRMSAVCWRRQNIQEGMIIWHGISTGNFVVNVNWKELTTGMKQKPEGVVESENFKIMWDFTVQCDRKNWGKKTRHFFGW